MRKKKTSIPEKILLSFSFFAAFVMVALGVGLRFISYEVASINRISGVRSLEKQENPGLEPFNFLVVGVDNSEGLDDSDPVLIGRNRGSFLTDTMIVVRVDPVNNAVAMVSIPRDLWVSVGGVGVKEKINAALTYGGPETLIATIRAELGISINHYVQVNFDGFRKLVENLNGVPLDFPYPVRDVKTGLSVEEPGCYFLDGEQGLALVRSRSYEIFDGEFWVSDPTGDAGRIARQQVFVEGMVGRAISKGARNPFALRSMFDSIKQDVTLDDQFSVETMFSLGNQFKDFPVSDLVKMQLPVVSGWEGDAWVVYLTPDAQPTLDVFRGVTPIPGRPQVEVLSPEVLDPFRAVPSEVSTTPSESVAEPSGGLTEEKFVPLAAANVGACL